MCDIIYFKKISNISNYEFFHFVSLDFLSIFFFFILYFRTATETPKKRLPLCLCACVCICICCWLDAFCLMVLVHLSPCSLAFSHFSFTVRDIQTRALSAFKHPQRCTISLIFMLRSQPETSLGKRIHQCNLKESISNDKLKVIFVCVEHIPKLKYITTATSLSSVIQINEVVV